MDEQYRPEILLAEDDENLGYVIRDNMEHHGFKVSLCVNGEEALETFGKRKFDICVLDIMLPKMDGFTLAEKIRETDSDIPVIFLTAKSMKEDKIRGFELGADDYIIKPFNIEELILRLKVFLKRTGKQNTPGIYRLGSYTFNYNNLELKHARETKRLTRKEADLLRLLCSNQNKMIKREEILNQIWGNDDYFAGRSMDVFISRLRRYLSHDLSIMIMNYHGVGFRFEIT